MTPFVRIAPARIALAFFTLLVTAPLIAQTVFDGPPLSADPKALLAAAEKVDAKDQASLYLLHEGTFTFQADGRTKSVWHQIQRIATADGVEEAGTVRAWWSPWYDERPVITARVIAKDGTVYTLDPKAIVEATAEEEQDMFSDQHVLRAPLPGVAAGSVIETVITLDGRSAIAGAGKSGRFEFGAGVPMEHSRLILDAPVSIPPRIVNKSGLTPRTVEENGRQRIIFERAHSDAVEDEETFLPSDELTVPYVAFSTGKSWHEIAGNYAAIVDKQIAADDLKDVVQRAIGTSTDRGAITAKLLDMIEKNVRYAGVEVGEGSIVPRAPKSVLQKKYGDCKDKATLLVAMLRTAGIPAHVALLDSGTGFDTIAELPGADNFNHAIVVVDGEPALWVDPTDEFARPGELPAQDQGRMALIASDSTTTLTRTPEAASSANRYIETRSYTLPEDGKAHVIEETEGTWLEDASLRRGRANAEKKDYREAMEKYVISYFVTPSLDNLENTDPRDFAKPFRVTLDMQKSKSGIVLNGGADVAIPIHEIVSYAPYVLRDYEEKPAEPNKKPAKKRVHDFVFTRPLTREWRYRIVPPPGFAARTLPASETTRLGTATLTTEYKTDSDGAIVARIAFDTGKRRLTPAEFEETRVALSKVAKQRGVHVGFEAAGQAKLNAGDIGGALAEFRKLAALHPKEAQHHIELSRALLAGGLGEAARDEARLAVKIEPSNAKAHSMLATTLEHDLLGREYRHGCDVRGAVAALRKAKELDSSDAELRARLAALLTFGDGDVKFGKNAPLNEAIAEYKSLLKDLGKDGAGSRPPLMLTLAYAQRWDEIQELLKEETDVRQHDLFRLMVVTVKEGAPAGLRELGAFDTTQRRSYGAALGQTLMALRRYSEAADFFEAATKGSPQAAQTLGLVQVLRKTQPYEKVIDGTPRTMPIKLMELLLMGDVKSLRASIIPELAETLDEGAYSLSTRSLGDAADAPPAVLLDLIGSAMEVQQDGDDETGYRLRLRAAAGTPSSVSNAAFYVQRRNGKYLFAGFNDPESTIGRAALALADNGKLEAARIWLNWARESISAGGTDDPLEGPPFARLWTKGKAEATADEIRIAAAALASGKDFGAKTIEVLTPLRDKGANDSAKAAIGLALLLSYHGVHDWAKAGPVAEQLWKAYPDSGVALMEWTNALTMLGRTDEAEAIAKARMAKLPKDEHAMRAMISISAKKGDYAAAESWARRVVDETTPTSNDYNEAAWVALFRGTELDRAIDDARRATSDEKSAAAGALNTLAALYAESGKTVEARQALMKAIDRRHTEEPSGDDWFVLGRIAETYGVRDAAIAAYKRVQKGDDSGMDTWELARRRMTVLGIK